MNTYVRIVLQQTLSDKLLDVLTRKIKYDNRGITAIKAAIGAEMQKYVTNGYINTDATWTDDDLYIDGNLIIKKGTALTEGYVTAIAPFSSLTAAEKAAHQFPKIYLIYADQFGIRKIVVSGQAFNG